MPIGCVQRGTRPTPNRSGIESAELLPHDDYPPVDHNVSRGAG